ncbi:MAG: DUF3237 domain-containing protein [Pseudomonadota bacterium]
MSGEPTIKTTFLCEARIPLEVPIDSGTSPEGQRMVFVVKQGTVTGPRLNGSVLGGSGADWARIRPDRSGALDVRFNIETDDGAILYCAWLGIMQFAAPDAEYALDFAKPDDPAGASRYYFRSSPRFETGDARYAWLNIKVCVCKSRTGNGGVIHQIFVVE